MPKRPHRASTGPKGPAAFRAAKEQLSAQYIRPARLTAAQSIRLAGPDPATNVVGVGIGTKVTRGQNTGRRAVKILVRHKLPLDAIEPRFRLPTMINGLPTDVEEVGLIVAFSPATPNPRTRIRPARPGCSIGFKDPQNKFKMAGTFGALVRNAAGTFVLSNNHVLADENKLPLQSPIFQPGLLDGGKPATDQIASLTRMIPLLTTKNSVDCAMAKILRKNVVSSSILKIGAPTGVKKAALQMNVHKFGRTTSYTTGRITSIDTDVKVQYDMGVLAFKSQIMIKGDGGTQRAIASTGYPHDRIRLVEGRVEDTVPATMPEAIALLRLDTDWYESTLHELRHLVPRVVSGGVYRRRLRALERRPARCGRVLRGREPTADPAEQDRLHGRIAVL